MALIDKKILTPIRYHQDNANTAIGQASTMKALFDQGAEDLRVELNGVIDELLATTGAQQIGIDPARGLGNTLADALTNIKNYMNLGASSISAEVIGTGSGDNVQAQLLWLMNQIKTMVLGQIPEGTISIDKLTIELANLINGHTTQMAQIEEDIGTHLAENVTRTVRITRDLSIAGTQVVGSLPFTPKGILAIASVNLVANKSSIGFRDQAGNQICHAIATGGAKFISGSSAISILESGTVGTNGVITVQDKQVTINWTLAGTGATGTVTVDLVLFAHGGV